LRSLTPFSSSPRVCGWMKRQFSLVYGASVEIIWNSKLRCWIPADTKTIADKSKPPTVLVVSVNAYAIVLDNA